jgi:hypothetical protein
MARAGGADAVERPPDEVDNLGPKLQELLETTGLKRSLPGLGGERPSGVVWLAAIKSFLGHPEARFFEKTALRSKKRHKAKKEDISNEL